MTTLQASARDQLRSIVQRIEHLDAEKVIISDEIREVYSEAKGNGFDTKALKAVIKLRKQDENRRKEDDAILETYLHALGMGAREMGETD